MKRIIKIKNEYNGFNKYVLVNEYQNFGIYQEKTPNGFFVHQSWLIDNNCDAQLVVKSYNHICQEELLDMIDNYNQRKCFGIKSVIYCDLFHMHPNGKKII